MIPLTLDQLADVVGGDVADATDGTRTISSVIIDSRAARPGALFVPLPGEHADGHAFVGDAMARGASGYLLASAARPLPEPGALVVDDCADALLGLGIWVRDTIAPIVVGVTGSQGKTTTKDLMGAAIGAGRACVASPGSFNNELGVPLTCCRLDESSEVLITEIGSRGIGQIARLAALVRPDIAVVTSVGASHLELLGDIETVARAKSELVEALPADGLAVLNADDPRVAAMAERTGARVITYGITATADWRASGVHLDGRACARFTAHGPPGEVPVRLALSGAHNVGNALAALAVADAVGVPLADAAAAVATAAVSRWRMELRAGPGGLVVINDAYNANPASTRAALDTLAALDVPGRRWAVLGLMAELGGTGDAEHASVGAHAAHAGVDRLVVVGRRAAAVAAGALEAGLPADAATVVADADAALTLLRAEASGGDAVLVKASRSVGLERVAIDLAPAASDAAAPGEAGA
ncbi:UDP-N-acetylmuramoyl-tripeptide--D-alanyl-D-alanine ligase [soil metagenome]